MLIADPSSNVLGKVEGNWLKHNATQRKTVKGDAKKMKMLARRRGVGRDVSPMWGGGLVESPENSDGRPLRDWMRQRSVCRVKGDRSELKSVGCARWVCGRIELRCDAMRRTVAGWLQWGGAEVRDRCRQCRGLAREKAVAGESKKKSKNRPNGGGMASACRKGAKKSRAVKFAGQL